ncbi:MAG: RidA family protein [Candidatus Latescibacterota bacterium]|nr:RidA family protein [Candidatus Latescibacterota bacterium]
MPDAFRLERGGTCHSEIQFARIDAGDLAELHCRVQPQDTAAGFDDQVRSVYVALSEVLSNHGLTPSDVVWEKLFFADIDRDFGAAQEIRTGFYGGAEDKCLPATSYLQQPPCHRGRLFELQALALHSRAEGHHVHTLTGLPTPASGKLVTTSGYMQLYLQNLVGGSDLVEADFRSQCAGLFENLATALRRCEVPLSRLIRTWIYLRDLEQDYDELNEVRNACFADWGIERPPASTGIQAGTFPWAWRCAADAYAVWGDGHLKVEAMHAHTLNEATEYGSAFSRGLRVERDDRTVLYVSGTASIDTRGDVVHVGNIEGQCHRMLDNVEALLAAHGAGLDDTLSAITYLKDVSYFPIFNTVCQDRRVPPGMLNSVVVADVCRPEWLCEIELAAVRPNGTAA